MLQFNPIVCIMGTKFTSRLCWRFTALFTSNPMVVAPEFSTMVCKQKHMLLPIIQKEVHQKNFETLKEKVQKSLKSNTSITSKIQQANNIDELLKLISVPVLTKDEISTVMEAIVSWVNENNRISPKPIPENVGNRAGGKDREVTVKIKSNTTEEEILKKYKDLSTTLMIQEVLKLAKQKKRYSKVLNYLLENIRIYNENIDVVNCSTLLYSMATLNYLDEKLCHVISENLIKNLELKTFTILKSVLQSMAMLRYKNVTFLKHACQLINNSKKLYTKDIAKAVQSFAMLGFLSDETNAVIEKYLPLVTIDLLGVDDWLNYVWCLTVLDNIQNSHIESVLNEQFIKTLFSGDVQKDILQQVKLLNINGAAKYLAKDYQGPLLQKDMIQNEVLPYSVEKKGYVNKLEETLNSMSKSRNLYRTHVNTGMGFLLDAECYVDSNYNFVDPNTAADNKIKKLAIIINDYNAYCHGVEDINGIMNFQTNLLNHSGYTVIPISYKHFGIEDSLVRLTSLLKSRIKES